MRYTLTALLLASLAGCSGAPVISQPSDVITFEGVSATQTVGKDGQVSILVSPSLSLFKIPVHLQTQAWRLDDGSWGGRVCVMVSLLGPKPVCFGGDRP